MKVSVIVPTYNRAHLLKKTIDSILNQTYKELELIVVNNCSIDDTEDVVKSFKDDRVHYFKNQNNGVIAVNRNFGIKKSSGEYIAFCDDDDVWLHNKLEKQVNYLRDHPEYQLVYSNAVIIDENGEQKGLLLIPESFKEGYIFDELLEDNFMPQSTILVRRTIFEAIGFFSEDPHLKAAEDYQYWLKASIRYKVGSLNEPLVMYRIHPMAESRNVNRTQLKLKVLASLASDPLLRDNKKVEKKMYDLYAKSAIYSWKNSDKTSSKKAITKNLGYNIRKIRILSVFNALSLWFLFNFDYQTVKSLKSVFSRSNG